MVFITAAMAVEGTHILETASSRFWDGGNDGRNPKKHHLRWLEHLARMESHRMPKQLLFVELQKKRPSHGIKRRWGDVAAADIKSVNAGAEWYDLAQDRNVWAAVWGLNH